MNIVPSKVKDIPTITYVKLKYLVQDSHAPKPRLPKNKVYDKISLDISPNPETPILLSSSRNKYEIEYEVG